MPKVPGDCLEVGIDLGDEVLEHLQFEAALLEYRGEHSLIFEKSVGGAFNLRGVFSFFRLGPGTDDFHQQKRYLLQVAWLNF